MADNEKLQPELPALTEEQVELVQQIATQAVRDALASAAAEASKSPTQRLSDAYADKNKPGA